MNEPIESQDAASGNPGDEVVSARTRFSSTVVGGDGLTRVATLSAQPVNFQDAAGAWQRIDTRLVASDDGWRTANGGSATLPSSADGWVTVTADDSAAVATRLVGAKPATLQPGSTDPLSAPRSDDTSRASSATAAEALPGVDLSWTAQRAGVKEAITLHGPEATPTLQFEMRLSDGLTPTLGADGSISYLARDGSTALVSPAPFMDDAAGAHSDAVSYKLEQQDGGWLLTASADPKWLRDPARAFPVVIDPTTVVFSGTALPCTIRASAATTCADFRFGNAGLPAESRTLLAIEPESLPRGVTVVSSTLNMTVQSITTPGSPLVLHAALIDQGWNALASCVSWTSTDCYSTPWATPGGTMTADTAVASVASPAIGTTIAMDMTAAVSGWSTMARPSRGVEFYATASGANELSVMNLGTGAVPTLSITYIPQLGSYNGSRLFTSPLTESSSVGVNLGTGNLLVSASDLGVGRTWNSQSTGLTAVPQIASGWSLSVGYDTRVSVNPLGHITYFAPDGGVYLFARKTPTGPDYFSPPGLTATAANTGTTITITYDRSATTLTFRVSDGQMTSIADRNGNTTAVAFPGAVSSTGGWAFAGSITDAAGRVTTINRSSSNVTGLTDTASRTASYGTTSGKLTTAVDANGKTTTYAYDSSSRIERITTPGGRVTRITYDPSNRVSSLIRVTNPAGAGGLGSGPTTTFAYAAPTALYAAAKTTVTDANLNGTVYEIDRAGKALNATDPLGHKQAAQWGSDNNVTSATDAMTGGGNVSTFSFDTDFRATGSSMPTGAASKVVYTAATGALKYLPTSSTDPQSKETTYSYDPTGNVTKAQDTTAGPTGGIAKTMTYNPTAASGSPMVCGGKPGQVCKSTDGNLHDTLYAYDTQGNLLTVTPPAPLAGQSSTYDSLGRTATHTDGKGQVTRFTYDNLNRTTQVQYNGITTCTGANIAAGLCITYGYDDDGNQTARADATGATAYGYDQLSRQTTKTTPGPVTVTLTYDAVGNVASSIEPSGTTNYAYFADNTLKSLAEPTGSCTGTFSLCTTFAYNANHFRTSTTYPNGTVQTVTPDNSGRATRIQAVNGATTISDLSYSYTASGGGVTDRTLVQSRTTTVGIISGFSTNYTYDNLARLLSASDMSGPTTLASADYTYDNAGNRTSQTITGYLPGTASATFAYNNADQLTTLNGSTTGWAYDANGSTTSMINTIGLTATRAFSYDAAGRNTSTTAGSATDAYTYAGGSNNERTSTTTGGTTTTFLNSLTGVTSSSGAAGVTVIREPGGKPIAVKSATAKAYVLTDSLGSVIALSNGASGTSYGRYSYDPYGNLRTTDQTDTTIGTLLTTNPIRYTGGWYDASTGLYKLGHRYYSPQYGRFTQPDPSGQEANAYAYVGDTPTNGTDRSGLDHATIPDDYIWVYNDTTGRHDYCSDSPDQFTGSLENSGFRGACARHDLCYDAADETGGGYGGCNNDLWLDMVADCDADISWWNALDYAACISTASAYWAAVTGAHLNNLD